jgi:hypothetical protein
MNASSTPAQSLQDYSVYVRLLGSLQQHRLFLEAERVRYGNNHDFEQALLAIRKASFHVNCVVAEGSFERNPELTEYRFVF